MYLTHPYANLTGGNWLRGNLHTHTTRSDGSCPPQAVIDDYAARGYGFLMCSDHDVQTSLADYAALESRGMILIPGNEISANGVHLLHVNGDRRVEPLADRQQVIDQIDATAGFAIVNHPNWFREFDHCTQEKLYGWQGYKGIEIFNGTIGRLEGSAYATDRWDRLLTAGRRVWGYAHDDSHLPAADVGLGWNVAYVTRRTVDGVVAALADGRFYASTGVVIDSLVVEGMKVAIGAANADCIIASVDGQKRIAVSDSDSLEVTVPPNARYLRLECWGHGEQFAWTQPFFVEP